MYIIKMFHAFVIKYDNWNEIANVFAECCIIGKILIFQKALVKLNVQFS